MNSTDGKEQTGSKHIEPTENPVARKMRQIYCCSGAEFTRPQLEAGWREIWRLEAEIAKLKGVAADSVSHPTLEQEAKEFYESHDEFGADDQFNTRRDCEELIIKFAAAFVRDRSKRA